MAASRYWRIKFDVTETTNGDTYFITLSSIQLRTIVGGTDVATTGTATATTFVTGFEPSKALDGNTTTNWASDFDNSAPSVEDFTITLPTSQDILEIAIVNGSALPNRYNTPRSAVIQTSTDGVTWTTFQTWTIGSWSTALQTKTLTLGDPPGTLSASGTASAVAAASGSATVSTPIPSTETGGLFPILWFTHSGVTLTQPGGLIGALQISATASGQIRTRAERLRGALSVISSATASWPIVPTLQGYAVTASTVVGALTAQVRAQLASVVVARATTSAALTAAGAPAQQFASAAIARATTSAALTATAAPAQQFASSVFALSATSAALTAPGAPAQLAVAAITRSTTSAALTAPGALIGQQFAGSLRAAVVLAAVLKQPAVLRAAIAVRATASELRVNVGRLAFVNGEQWVRSRYHGIITTAAGERSALTLLLGSTNMANNIAAELPVGNAALFWCEISTFQANAITGDIEEATIVGRNDVSTFISATKELSSSSAIHSDLIFGMVNIPNTNRYYIYPQGDVLQSRLLPTYRDQKVYVHFTMGAGEWHEVAETTLVDERAAVN